MQREIGGRTIIFNAILAGLGLLSLVVSFNPQWHLWGLDYVSYLPVWLRFILAAGLAAFCIPAFSRTVGDRLFRIKSAFAGPPEMITYAVIAGAIILLFVSFSSKNHILGDGYVIQGTIAQGKYFSPTEPLDYLFHHLIFKLMGTGGERGAHLSYLLTSYLCGAAYLLILFILLRKKAGFIFSLAVSFCFGIMQFFFGYVENYTISFVFLFLFLVSGWDDLAKGRTSLLTILSLVLAITLNVNSAIFLIPLGYLFWLKSPSRKLAAAWAGGLLMLATLGIVYIKLFTEINIFEIVVPPVRLAENPYSLFSAAHLFDLLNLWLLDFPLLLICPWLLREMDRRQRRFFAATVLPALLFTIFIDPRLGAPRDWDLLSIPAAPIIVFIITVYGLGKGRLRRAGFEVIVPILLFSLLHTGSWIAANTDKNESYVRLKRLVRNDPHYSIAYYKGFRNKSWAWIAKNRFDDIDETIRVNQLRLQGDPSDSLNIYNLAINYAEIKDTLKAVQLIRHYWRRFESSSLAMSYYADVMYSLRYYQDAEEILGRCISLGNDDYSLFLLLGQVMEATGRSDSAFLLYDKAFILRKDAPLKDELIFYAQAVTWGKYALAESGLRRISPRIRSGDDTSVSLLIDALSSHDYKRADSIATFLFNTLRAEKKKSLTR